MIDPIIRKSIEKRIADLEAQKLKVVENANAQLNAIAGAAGELERLLKEMDESEEEEE
jgi:hypothetical protein